MSKDYNLNKFSEDVKKIRQNAKNRGFNDKQITNILRQVIEEHKRKHNSSKCCGRFANFKRNAWKYIAILIVLLSVFLYVLLNVHTPTSSIVLRNVQGLTYPALRIIRILSVPVLRLFPSLTDLYDESCLVENPYFFVSDMECWPCENTHSVIDLSGLEEFSFNKIGEGTPFIAKTKQNIVSLKDIKSLYNNYTKELDSDLRRLKTSNTNITSIKDLIKYNEKELSSNFHIQWRVNKMTAARIIRKMFPRPYFLPERSGQAVERFLIIDGPDSPPYNLPNTECSYVFIIQGTGERTIILQPSNECQGACKSVSVVLKPTYMLFYNWWYWRPISLPLKNATGTSVSYVNSYC